MQDGARAWRGIAAGPSAREILSFIVFAGGEAAHGVFIIQACSFARDAVTPMTNRARVIR